MIKIEKTEVMNFDAAIRGMRKPMNSGNKSDSAWTYIENPITHNTAKFQFFIGKNDLELMKKLCNSGSDHRKFMRMIFVSMDITAPLYWWKEFDTYKVGTVANSTSTMHKIHSRDLTVDDFSTENLLQNGIKEPCTTYGIDYSFAGDSMDGMSIVISLLNFYRQKYIETGNKLYWYQLIQLLPSSYNQLRTITLNYEVLYNIYKSRKNHKLYEWRELCEWIEKLPYFMEIIKGEVLKNE